jgi:hypothetical protein
MAEATEGDPSSTCCQLSGHPIVPTERVRTGMEALIVGGECRESGRVEADLFKHPRIERASMRPLSRLSTNTAPSNPCQAKNTGMLLANLVRKVGHYPTSGPEKRSHGAV